MKSMGSRAGHGANRGHGQGCRAHSQRGHADEGATSCFDICSLQYRGCEAQALAATGSGLHAGVTRVSISAPRSTGDAPPPHGSTGALGSQSNRMLFRAATPNCLSWRFVGSWS